jgi:hypothetical protein
MSDTEEKAGKSGGTTYDERCKAVSPIAKPLASKKMTKKLYKLVKKASAAKFVRRGVKEVVKVRSASPQLLPHSEPGSGQ